MGDVADTTSVKTDDTTDTGDTDTLLTGDTGADDSTETNLDADANASADDATNTDDNSDSGDAGKEGSDTPPDTYADFVMPEGIELDVAALEQATPLFKELGLNQEQSQKAVDLYAQLIQAGSVKQNDDFNQLMTDWRTQSENDKEYGGDKFAENVSIAQNAINTYGTPELKQLLEEQGVGNHPEVIRFMVRVGRTLSEDVPGAAGGAASESKDRVTQMYGNQSEKT